MERFSYRDHILLGLGHSNPWRSIGKPSSSPDTQSRNSDEVDFSDVFGGPPRRSSVHELRQSVGGSVDTDAYREVAAVPSRSSWSALSEKPVFGEGSPIRRRYQSGDFYNDIFRVDDSSASTPRKPDRNSSSILSPIRPLPSKAETFGPSSLPTQISGNSYRNKDGASNAGFPSSPRTSISGASNQVIQGQDDLRNSGRLSFHQSPLSQEFSLDNKESPRDDKLGNEDKRGNSPKMHGEQFHFSIYKWASKGVPLVMPSKGGKNSSSKERGNDFRSTSLREMIKRERVVSEVVPVEFPSVNDGILSVNSSFHTESGKQGSISILNSMTEDRIDSFKFTEKAAFPKPDREPSTSITTEVSHIFTTQKEGNETNYFSDVSGPSLDKGLRGSIKEEAYVSIQGKGKAESKSLHSLLHNDSDKQGKKGMARQVKGKEDKESRVGTIDISSGSIGSDKKLEKQDKRNMSGVAVNSGLQDTRENSRDKHLGIQAKGKVKEFVKIFNQEAPSPKHITNDGTKDHSSGEKEKGVSEADHGAQICASNADWNQNMTNVNRDKTSKNGRVDQTLKQSGKSHFVHNTHKSDDISSGRTGNPASSSENVRASFETPLWNVEESHIQDVQENYLVEEPSLSKNRQQEAIGHQEEIQISDAKIRQWSKGKETNIRALLSTLQYVLWPESGWKPVPLVNIIEGSSVRKAYQKALLCLHPDKLQQKGAASQQKYIAEKVFDILQGKTLIQEFSSLNLLAGGMDSFQYAVFTMIAPSGTSLVKVNSDCRARSP